MDKNITGTALQWSRILLKTKQAKQGKHTIVKKAGTGIMKIIFNSITNKIKNREYTYTSR